MPRFITLTSSLLAAALLLAGCASLEERRQNFQASQAIWLGKTLDELVLSKGPPTRTATLSQGGQVVEYESLRQEITGGGSYVTYQSVPVVGANGVVSQVQVPMQQSLPMRAQLRSCRLLFVVTAERRIESWRHEGDDCF